MSNLIEIEAKQNPEVPTHTIITTIVDVDYYMDEDCIANIKHIAEDMFGEVIVFNSKKVGDYEEVNLSIKTNQRKVEVYIQKVTKLITKV